MPIITVLIHMINEQGELEPGSTVKCISFYILTGIIMLYQYVCKIFNKLKLENWLYLPHHIGPQCHQHSDHSNHLTGMDWHPKVKLIQITFSDVVIFDPWPWKVNWPRALSLTLCVPILRTIHPLHFELSNTHHLPKAIWIETHKNSPNVLIFNFNSNEPYIDRSTTSIQTLMDWT